MARAVGVDALAVDVFEREVGLAVLGDAGVEQAGDVRVVQRGQDLALARHAFGQPGAAPGTVGQLERHLAALQHVGALGQPHAGHAAAAELAQQAVGADAFGRGLGPRRREVGRLDLGQRVHHQLCRARRMLEQRAQARLEVGPCAVQRVEPGGALRRIELETVVEQAPQRCPLAGVQIEVPLGHRRVPFESLSSGF